MPVLSLMQVKTETFMWGTKEGLNKSTRLRLEREREREKQKATTERKSFSMIQENKTKTFFAYFKSVPAKQSCSQCTQINKDSKYDTLKMSTTGTNRL